VSRRGSRPARHSRPQAGYALLFAVFLAATMFLLATVAAPSILNQGRRQREQQLIWRGNQYVRGIRLYFQKNGRFPQNKEELVKGTLDVHFVRKAYSDPVGPQDADWRFIYVAPSGQLTGSVRYHTLQEMAATLGGGQNAGNLAALFGGPPAAQGAGNAGAAGAAGAEAGRGGAPAAGARGGPAGGAAAGAAGEATGSAAGETQSADGGPTPVPLEAVDGPVFGASLIGVASKVKADSLLVYQGRDNYFEWEFIWNPLLSRGLGGTQAPGGVPAGATLGPGAGTGTGAGTGMGNLPPIGNPGVGAQRGPGRGPVPAPGMPGTGRP
jgi:type II secretory pathway pseudopilin PulG